MKITREEFKELVKICQDSHTMSKDDLLDSLFYWLSKGLGFMEEDMAGPLLYNILDGDTWGFGPFDEKIQDIDLIYDLCLKNE